MPTLGFLNFLTNCIPDENKRNNLKVAGENVEILWKFGNSFILNHVFHRQKLLIQFNWPHIHS